MTLIRIYQSPTATIGIRPLGSRPYRDAKAVTSRLSHRGLRSILLLRTVDRLSVQTFVFPRKGRIRAFSGPGNCDDEVTVKVVSRPLLRHSRCVASVS